MIHFCCLCASHIMIALYSNKRDMRRETTRDILDSIFQHLLMYITSSAVSLHKVTCLIDKAGCVICQLLCPFYQPGTPICPHLSIPLKLFSMHCIRFLIGIIIITMVYRSGSLVIMGISQYHHRIVFDILLAFPRCM